MKHSALALGTALTISVSSIFPLQSAQAVQLRDGKTYFTTPPTLVEAVTTRNTVYVWGATYYFTVKMSANAGEPLDRVTIKQHEGGENVQFDLAESRAFEGERSQEGSALGIKSTQLDKETNTISVIFDPPIQPGKTITIGLRPYNNPRYSGVYLFGVTAFPPGNEQAYGQFLGYGRLHFYERTRFF